MLQSKYQRVGALAGLLLFLGSWLTAYYNHWVWALLTAVFVIASFWLALDGDTSEELSSRVIKGFTVGLISAVVGRILGLLSMAWAFDSWTGTTSAKYDTMSDLFRVILNGRFWVSLVAIFAVGLVGEFVAYAIPYFSAEREEE